MTPPLSAAEAAEIERRERADNDPNAPRHHAAPDLVDVILGRASEGFVHHTVGREQLYRLRRGGVAILTGAPGSGKTSLSIGIAIEHARDRGPVVYASLEMDADELAARAAGMRCDASWEDVLCGRVRREFLVDALDLPRLAILDGEDATLAEVERAVWRLRDAHGDEPILVVVDYVQILPGAERDVRSRVAASAQAIRRLAKRLRVVALVISQPSRAAGRALASGELTGADSMTAMAESAEIERAAYVTLAIGAHATPAEDGARAVELSIGTSRMGGGDRVVPMRFDGRTGRWTVAGDAKPAAEAREERQARHDAQRVTTVAHAVADLLRKSPGPMSRREIRAALGGKDNVIRAAVTSLLEDPAAGVVEVEPKERSAYKVWTRDRAITYGRAIVVTASTASQRIPTASRDAQVTASPPLIGRDADAVTESWEDELFAPAKQGVNR